MANHLRRRANLLIMAPWLIVSLSAIGQEPVFSGPQKGEKLLPFKLRGVFDAEAGKELDFVTEAGGKPLLLVFVHEANRPSIGFTRALVTYAASRKQDGLASGVAWLADDQTAAKQTLDRMRHALPTQTPIAIAEGGKEGPGALGLNRQVTLTILVAKENKVTANFALVQPSLQADLPKVLAAVVEVAGGKVPRLEDTPGVREMMGGAGRRSGGPDPALAGMLRAVIQKDATKARVEAAAAKVEAHVEKDAAARREVGRIANTIVAGGKLTDIGTPRAQEFLRKWAKAYGAPDAKRDDKPLDAKHKP